MANRKEMEKEIKEAFGFVPEFYSSLPDVTAEHAWGAQRDLEMGESALDGKTKELIGLAIAAHIKCKYCIYFHDKAARMHGANEEEIREALAMSGLTVSFSNSISGVGTDFDKFKKDVDRGMEYARQHAQQPSAH
jgi:AhpD family alkylhydroperoxidase